MIRDDIQWTQWNNGLVILNEITLNDMSRTICLRLWIRRSPCPHVNLNSEVHEFGSIRTIWILTDTSGPAGSWYRRMQDYASYRAFAN